MKSKSIFKNTKIAITVIVGLSLLLAFAQCKRDKPDEPSQEELIQLTDESIESINEIIEEQEATLQGLEPAEALVKLSEWLTTFEGIVSATPYDMDSISIVFADGTRGDVFIFDETIEEVVESKTTPFDFENLNHKKVLDNVIVSNRKVLYWAPYELDFDPILDGRTVVLDPYYARDFDVTVMNDDMCTVASLRDLTQFGTVLIDSHGLVNKILTSENVTINKNKEYRYELDNGMVGRTLKVHHKPNGHYSMNPLVYTVKSKFIENLEGRFENSLVFVATCYSKHRLSQLCQAFINKGASAYFGFTDRARNPYCFDCLILFSNMMVHYEINTGALYDLIKADPYYKSRICKNGGRSWEVFLEMEGDENISYYEEGPMPQIITGSVENITATSALLKGTIVTGKGSHVIVERGFCFGDTPQQYYGNDESEIIVCEGTETADYSYEITGLYPNKQYYVRAYAITISGEVCYGDEVSFTTNSEYLLTIQTLPVGNITATSAMFRGVITEGEFITRGFCYGTSPNVTVGGAGCQQINVSGNYLGQYEYTCEGLSPSTPYYVKAFALVSTNPLEFVYGDEVSFTTLNTGGDHEYVDLGLPSGLLWATRNVGANAPEEYGDYFAWGETQPKDVYSWDTYQYYDGGNMTKYTGSDGLTILLPEDDAATANWGNGWRMPTKEEWEELYQNTTSTWTTQNGVNGRLFTAPNGNSLFLPAAGNRRYGDLEDVGYYGYYWSSSLSTAFPRRAWYIYFLPYDRSMSDGDRGCGPSVRAVRSARQN